MPTLEAIWHRRLFWPALRHWYLAVVEFLARRRALLDIQGVKIDFGPRAEQPGVQTGGQHRHIGYRRHRRRSDGNTRYAGTCHPVRGCGGRFEGRRRLVDVPPVVPCADAVRCRLLLFTGIGAATLFPHSEVARYAFDAVPIAAPTSTAKSYLRLVSNEATVLETFTAPR